MSSKIEKDIGQRIREIREDKDKKQKDIADALNVTIPVVSRIESGKRELKLWELEIIAKSLGVGLNDLISIDKISETIDSFMNLFKIITTSKEYPIEKDGVIDADNLLLKSNKECLVLTAKKPIFYVVKKIAEVKAISSKIENEVKREEFYLKGIEKIKEKYKHMIKYEEESYFLISKDELTDIIKENVSRELKLSKILNDSKNNM